MHGSFMAVERCQNEHDRRRTCGEPYEDGVAPTRLLQVLDAVTNRRFGPVLRSEARPKCFGFALSR